MEANKTATPSQISAPVAEPVRASAAWRVACAAVRGVSHERLDLPCQDAAGYLVRPDGALLIALADGAGSAQYSDQGANRAVEAALRALANRLERTGDADVSGGTAGSASMPDDELMAGIDQPAIESTLAGETAPEEFLAGVLREAFSAARQAVFELAEEQPADLPVTPRDFASTLTCAIALGGRLAVGQVGDGAVVAVDADGELFAVTRLQRGEYANETHFLIEEDALDQLVIEVTDRPVNGLAVMSDGLIRLALKMPSQEPHAPFFQPLFRFVETVEDEAEAARQLAGFLNSERVNARTDDDKSLVLAARIGPVEDTILAAQPVQTGATQAASNPESGDEAALDRAGE